jgi:hypothetical protein
MKNISSIISVICIAAIFPLTFGCGGGSDKKDGSNEKVVLTEKGNLLCSTSWKLDPNATIKGSTDTLKDATNVTANIELKDDVKAIADFVAETVVFGIDQKDATKLSYSRTIGEGLFSVAVLGYWSFNNDETAVIMREWDSQAGKEMAPVTYKIVELTKEKLVLLKEGDTSPNIYFAKK